MRHDIRFTSPLLATALLWATVAICGAQVAKPKDAGGGKATPQASADVQQLVKRIRRSVVVINAQGRDQGTSGVGTGFVVNSEGLIATNLHVVGEGRPIRVQTVDGRNLRVVAVHAWNRELDLAVLRVEPEGGKLPALELGTSVKLEDGLPVVVMGNPLGWKYSVVTGVLSGTREVSGRTMLQLAVPIEPGNSGGPVTDAEGRVLGVVTMKSLVTQNLGFAVGVDDLKPLLEKPNPVPLDRWLKIGSLNPERWQPLFGAQWFERGGTLRVRGKGRGFGGRSLCLSRAKLPEAPFEVAAEVLLDDESGAAGLVFHADGGDHHYGFYPSNGRLRLSRFDGPDVLSWKVLEEIETPHYRPEEWNHLKVRIESGQLRGYVNDQLILEKPINDLAAGRVGLAKFRDTTARFRNFRTAKSIEPSEPTEEQITRLKNAVEQLPPLAEDGGEALSTLQSDPVAGRRLLRRQAEELEQRAAELRRTADRLHVQQVTRQLQALVNAAPNDFDLMEASLLVARLDDRDVDVRAYRDQVRRMAREVRETFTKEASPAQKLAKLNNYLFKQNGFHGSRYDYYHAANSHMHRVIDDRVGLPITLSVLYIELARELDVQLVGVGLPGHFVVRRVTAKEDKFPLIDVFNQGATLDRKATEEKVRETTGGPLSDDYLKPSTHLEILLRMLGNLKGVAQDKADREALLRYLDAELALVPDDTSARGMRSIVQFESGRHAAAIEDLNQILKQKPAGLDLNRIRDLREYFERKRKGP